MATRKRSRSGYDYGKYSQSYTKGRRRGDARPGAFRRPRGRSRRNTRTGGFLGIELKFLDCAWNAVTINSSSDGAGGELQPSSGCTDAISVPQQGDGESQRDGRKYAIKSVWVSGTIDTTPKEDQGDMLETAGTFFALVLDTQANGSTVNSEDVYLNPSSGTLAMLPQPLRNLQNSKRFRILATKYVPPGGVVAGTDGTNTNSLNVQNAMCVSLNWKGEIICDSTGTTADVASAADNAIHLICYSGGLYSKKFTGKSRVRFVG